MSADAVFVLRPRRFPPPWHCGYPFESATQSVVSHAPHSAVISHDTNSVERLTGPDGVDRMTLFSRRLDMARKSKLTQAAVKIGTAIGKADRTAHQIAKAGKAAKDELADIGAQINTLKRQLLKTKKRLQRALK
jgi:hypothetical protein